MKYGPYSPSRLDTALCGYSFHKQYISKDKPKRVEGVAQARGSAVHEVFEQITARLIRHVGKEHPSFNPEEVRQWVVEALNRHPAAYPETADILDMAKRYIDRPPSVLTADAEIELRLAIKRVGKGWEECHYDDPQAFARGRADIMLIADDARSALVYDHKTQPNVEEADTKQMAFYAWVISKINPGLENIQTVLHFARYGVYSDPHVWDRSRVEKKWVNGHEVDVVVDDLAQVEDIILTEVDAIESRTSWEPTPNKNCQYCPFIAECPVMQQYIHHDNAGWHINKEGFKILGQVDKAVEVAGAITVMEEALKLARKELREHVKGSEFGVSIPGRVFEFRVEETIDWDKVNKFFKERAYAVFEKYGVDPRIFMGFTQTHSKEVWLLGNKPLLDELSALFPRKKSSEFGGHKA
jgi:hypothetical protein